MKLHSIQVALLQIHSILKSFKWNLILKKSAHLFKAQVSVLKTKDLSKKNLGSRRADSKTEFYLSKNFVPWWRVLPFFQGSRFYCAWIMGFHLNFCGKIFALSLYPKPKKKKSLQNYLLKLSQLRWAICIGILYTNDFNL